MTLRPEDLVKAIFADTRDIIIVADPDRRIVAVNSAFRTLFGYADSEIAGQSTRILYADADDYDRVGADRYTRKAFDQGELYRIAYRTATGDSFVGETRLIAIHDKAGALTGIAAIIRNVTERLRREAVFKAIAEVTADARCDAAGRIGALLEAVRGFFAAEAAAVALAGEHACVLPGGVSVAPGGLTGTGAEELAVAAAQAAPHSPAGDPAWIPVGCGRGWFGENLLIDSACAGALVLVCRKMPGPAIPAHAAEVLDTIGTIIASHVKLAAQTRALEAGERRFRALYRRTPAMMHSIDSEGRLIEVSDAWLDVLGYRREDVVGRRSIEFLDADSQRRALEDVLPAFRRSGRCDRVPYTVLTSDGVPVEVELSGVLGEDGLSLAVLENVTERNAARLELLHKNAALEAVNENLHQFTSIASHDLQEPLRKIRAFCDVLEEALERGDREEAGYAMGVLRGAAERSSRQISDLLSFAKIGHRSYVPVEFDIAEAVAQAIDDLSATIAEAKAEVELDLAPLPVTGDRSAFVQLLANLLANAVKYRRETEAPRIVVSVRREGSATMLRVADNGIGFDARHADVIFEPFRRLHSGPRYEGAGIGLAICRKVAERHGWSLAVERTGPEGSTFRLEIAR